jgi:hypothetical protein
MVYNVGNKGVFASMKENCPSYMPKPNELEDFIAEFCLQKQSI